MLPLHQCMQQSGSQQSTASSAVAAFILHSTEIIKKNDEQRNPSCACHIIIITLYYLHYTTTLFYHPSVALHIIIQHWESERWRRASKREREICTSERVSNSNYPFFLLILPLPRTNYSNVNDSTASARVTHGEKLVIYYLNDDEWKMDSQHLHRGEKTRQLVSQPEDALQWI